MADFDVLQLRWIILFLVSSLSFAITTGSNFCQHQLRIGHVKVFLLIWFFMLVKLLFYIVVFSRYFWYFNSHFILFGFLTFFDNSVRLFLLDFYWETNFSTRSLFNWRYLSRSMFGISFLFLYAWDTVDLIFWGLVYVAYIVKTLYLFIEMGRKHR